MKQHARNLALLYVALCALAVNAAAQERRYAEAPDLKLTLTADKTNWRPGEGAPVRVRIENAAAGSIEIPSSIRFTADNRPPDDERATLREGVLSSPVSLTKSYAGPAQGCRNDLTPDRVETSKKVVVLHPAKDKLALKKGEAAEFSFDLAGTCWKHLITSFYAHDSIFKVAGGYTPNSYRVYFQMSFRMRTDSSDSAPRYFHLKSNEVEVTIN